MILDTIYYVIYYALSPFEYLWASTFQTPLRLNKRVHKKIVIFDTSGGSGKTTLARNIVKQVDSNYSVVSQDDYKYGEGWQRRTDEEFTQEVNEAIEDCDGQYVYEGTYMDLKLPAQRVMMDELIEGADLVIWYDTPKWVIVWRKALRSLKRWLRVEPQGSGGLETLTSVKNMIKKLFAQYDDRRTAIESMWKKKIEGDVLYEGKNVNVFSGKLRRMKWPYYYDSPHYFSYVKGGRGYSVKVYDAKPIIPLQTKEL